MTTIPFTFSLPVALAQLEKQVQDVPISYLLVNALALA
jgi:hypothetical protein